MRRISFIMTGITIVYSIIAFAIAFLTNSKSWFTVLVGYFIYVVIYILYIFTTVMFQLTKVGRELRRKRLKRFILIASLCFATNVVSNKLFDLGIDIRTAIFPMLGASFGVSYFDLAFMKKDIGVFIN